MGVPLRGGVLAGVAVLATMGAADGPPEEAAWSDARARVRDATWLWALEVDDFGAARELMVPHVIRAIGRDLPPLREGERELLAASGRVTCEINAGDDFDFAPQLSQVQAWATELPNIEAVLIDDMTTGKISRGLRPEHLARLCRQLQSRPRPLSLWGVVYGMSLPGDASEGLPDLAGYLRYLDVLTLWTWRAEDIPHIEDTLERCNQLSGGKPVILGLYLHDYGGGRAMPLEPMRQQCETARRLLAEGRILGVAFLVGPGRSYREDEPAIAWWRRWLDEVGDQPVSP